MTMTSLPTPLTPESVLNAAEASALLGIQPPRLISMKTTLLEAGATVTGGKRNSKWSIPVSALINAKLLDDDMKPIPRARAQRRTKEEVLLAKLAEAEDFTLASQARVSKGKKMQADLRKELDAVRAKKRADAAAQVEKAKRVLAEYEPLLAG